jgi:hypothetical protein
MRSRAQTASYVVPHATSTSDVDTCVFAFVASDTDTTCVASTACSHVGLDVIYALISSVLAPLLL